MFRVKMVRIYCLLPFGPFPAPASRLSFPGVAATNLNLLLSPQKSFVRVSAAAAAATALGSYVVEGGKKEGMVAHNSTPRPTDRRSEQGEETTATLARSLSSLFPDN